MGRTQQDLQADILRLHEYLEADPASLTTVAYEEDGQGWRAALYGKVFPKELEAQIRRELQHPSAFRTYIVRVSLQELEELTERVCAAAKAGMFAPAILVGVGPDGRNGMVDVQFDRWNDELAQQLRAAFGDMVELVWPPGIP